MRGPRKLGIPALVLAILIGLSRLYVGVHYPTDVLGGAIIGICSAMLSMWLVPIVEKKLPKIQAEIRARHGIAGGETAETAEESVNASDAVADAVNAVREADPEADGTDDKGSE